jgi:hypothetical protein
MPTLIQPVPQCNSLSSFSGNKYLAHPPYSPDLTHSDTNLIRLLKKDFKEKYFWHNNMVKVMECQSVQTLSLDILSTGMKQVVYQWDKCLNPSGYNVEKKTVCWI